MPVKPVLRVSHNGRRENAGSNMKLLQFDNWSDYHHQIYRIYHAIIALSLVPFFMLFLELEVAQIKQPRVSVSWVGVVLALLIPICVYLTWIVWKGASFRYGKMDSLKDKLVEFRRVEVTKYLVLEGVCFLGVLGLWLTAHYVFIIIYFAVLVQFSFSRPSEDRIVRAMKLTKAERELLRNDIGFQ